MPTVVHHPVSPHSLLFQDHDDRFSSGLQLNSCLKELLHTRLMFPSSQQPTWLTEAGHKSSDPLPWWGNNSEGLSQLQSFLWNRLSLLLWPYYNSTTFSAQTPVPHFQGALPHELLARKFQSQSLFPGNTMKREFTSLNLKNIYYFIISDFNFN